MSVTGRLGMVVAGSARQGSHYAQTFSRKCLGTRRTLGVTPERVVLKKSIKNAEYEW